MSNRDPGWFPDPAGTNQQRYWDGTSWTNYFLPAGVPTGYTPNFSGDTSAYSYLDNLASPAPSPQPYVARSAEDPADYPDATPASGAYPILDGPLPAQTDSTATPTFQAGSYHAPQYVAQGPHPGYGSPTTVVGDDPQRPYVAENPQIKKVGIIAGISVAVILVMALSWSFIMKPAVSDPTPVATTPTGPSSTPIPPSYTLAPGENVLLDFEADAIIVIEAEITEAGFYAVEVRDRSYRSDLHAVITTAKGDVIADDRSTSMYGPWINPTDPLGVVWWEEGTYPITISQLATGQDAEASISITRKASELQLNLPLQMRLPANTAQVVWIEIPTDGRYEFEVEDLNGWQSYIGLIDSLGYVSESSFEDPNDFVSTLSGDFAAGPLPLVVWSQDGHLTEVVIRAHQTP